MVIKKTKLPPAFYQMQKTSLTTCYQKPGSFNRCQQMLSQFAELQQPIHEKKSN